MVSKGQAFLSQVQNTSYSYSSQTKQTLENKRDNKQTIRNQHSDNQLEVDTKLQILKGEEIGRNRKGKKELILNANRKVK